MNKNRILPFLFDGQDEGYFYNTIFTENFGKFVKDEEVGRLYVDYEEGYIASENGDGDIEKYQNFKAVWFNE